MEIVQRLLRIRIHEGVNNRGANYKSKDDNNYGNVPMNYSNNLSQANGSENDSSMSHTNIHGHARNHSRSHSRSHSNGDGYPYDSNSILPSIFGDQSFDYTNNTSGNNGNGSDINGNSGGGNGINFGLDYTDIYDTNEINEISKIFESLTNMENDTDFGKMFSSFE
ncbi:unnamed protein product [[Candida] boidinii]|nr:unnamed protein product [[Candida] boidinii]